MKKEDAFGRRVEGGAMDNNGYLVRRISRWGCSRGHRDAHEDDEDPLEMSRKLLWR
jgi:hypothetical protein